MTINEKIKHLRLSKHLTLNKLAQISNLTKGYLSKIERSDKTPPVSTLQTLAVAMGEDIAYFFEENTEITDTSHNIDLLRKSENTQALISQGSYSYKPLVKHLKSKYMAPFIMTIEKGETEIFTHDSEEFDFVVSGSIIFEYDGESHVFSEGDGFYFDSRKPHKFINKSDEPAIVTAVVYNYRRF